MRFVVLYKLDKEDEPSTPDELAVIEHLIRTMTRSGWQIAANRIQPRATGTRKDRTAVISVTDGPFAETKS